MRKILIITPNCPFPPHKSGGIHTIYHLLLNKNDSDVIDLLYYDEEDKNAEQEISKYVNKVAYQSLRKKYKLAVRMMSILRRIPYGIFQYKANEVKVTESYDIVIYDQNLSLKFIDYVRGKKNILLAHDSMILYFKRKSELNSRYSINYLYNIMQSAFYRCVTEKMYTKFDKIYFVSKLDSEYESYIHKEVKNKLDFINLGVDYEKFNPKMYKEISQKEDSVIFTGIMDYAPNKDAALFLCKNIFPKLLEKHSNLKLYLVGKNPDSEILDLKSNNIIITGFVDDIVEYICKTTVYVSPLRFGTGMKNKILEAMSCGKAIVASEVSVEGIDELISKKNIFVCKSEDEWVESILILLEDEKLRNAFGGECRKIIMEKYSWSEAYKKLLNI